MAQDIVSAIAALVAKQQALVITSPVTPPATIAVKQVFNLPPNRATSLNSCPCWINTWQLNSVEWGLDVLGGPRHEFYTVHAQLFIDDSDTNVGAQIASAFLYQMLQAIKNDYTLGGVCQQYDIRGGQETLAMLEWGGQGYPGLDLYFDIEIVN